MGRGRVVTRVVTRVVNHGGRAVAVPEAMVSRG